MSQTRKELQVPSLGILTPNQYTSLFSQTYSRARDKHDSVESLQKELEKIEKKIARLRVQRSALNSLLNYHIARRK